MPDVMIAEKIDPFIGVCYFINFNGAVSRFADLMKSLL